MATEQIERILIEIKSRWQRVAIDAVVEDSLAAPSELVYACAFWLFYFDYSEALVPGMGLNCESAPSASRLKMRWAPAEWKISVHRSVESMRPLYGDLTKALENCSDAQWDSVIELHHANLCMVCREVTAAYHSGSARFSDFERNPEFVMLVLHYDDGDEVFEMLLRESMLPEMTDRVRGLPSR